MDAVRALFTLDAFPVGLWRHLMATRPVVQAGALTEQYFGAGLATETHEHLPSN
jgi:hypothetical protein